MKNEPPIMYIIAGPNGIGKTSSFYNDFPVNCPFINADEISTQLKSKLNSNINIQELANREAIALINDYLINMKTFGFETNLADLETWKFIEKIKILGYQIYINFYCVDDVTICINRVRQRVLEGGHDVRKEIIIQRYNAGLSLIKHYINIPNTLILTDNTFQSTISAVFNEGIVTEKSEVLPNWVLDIVSKISETSIVEKIDDSFDTIKNRYKSQK